MHKKILKAEKIFCLVLSCLMLFFVWLQIFTRAGGFSLRWSEELSRYILVWMVFVGSAAGISTSDHIGSSFFIDKLKGRKKSIALLIQNLFFLAFFLFFGYYSLPFIMMQQRFGQTSETMPIPMYLITIIIPITCILSAYHIVHIIVTLMKDIKKPSEKRGGL